MIGDPICSDIYDYLTSHKYRNFVKRIVIKEMFKQILNLAGRLATPVLTNNASTFMQNFSKSYPIISPYNRGFCTLLSQKYTNPILFKDSNLPQTNKDTVRTLVKYSWGKGKRKSVNAVLKRFYRLHWGGWIRTRCGRNKKLWKKRAPQRRRLRQHVFCNASQSTLLDKMVGKYWTKPKYYVDDIYEPYHVRDEFVYSSKRPRPYIPPEER